MRVVLCYKNFAASKHISHIGLGVAGLNTCKVLQHHGIQCDVWPIVDVCDLIRKLDDEAHHPHHGKITHVVISAPWIPTDKIRSLCFQFPRIHFAVSSHSNVGFLQADPNGTKLFREALELEMELPNFSAACNSERMAHWVIDAYGHPCVVLPNLYFLNDIEKHHRPLWRGGLLKVGIFGAIRPQKNLASAVAAAVELHHQLKSDTQIWISSGRTEGGGATILNTVRALVCGVPGVTLHEGGWQTWPKFRHLVGSMHLLLQPSYTESFNMVTADGIAEGVPSVVSDAIHWVPRHWQADSDDVFDIARVGRHLLSDPHAASEGLHHLKHYVENGIRFWKEYLSKTLKDF